MGEVWRSRFDESPYWWEKFDFSPRHCFKSEDGEYLQFNGQLCIHWRDHIHNVGKVQYMRWISEFAKLVPGVVTEFEDGWLRLIQTSMRAPGFTGLVNYCEDYGGKVKGFLNKGEAWAVVEVHDPKLFRAAEQASENVNRQYKEMISGK